MGLLTASQRTVVGLAPDGVATVIATYTRGPKITVPVTNNFYGYTLAHARHRRIGRQRIDDDASPDALTWLGADGKVLNRITSP